MRSMTKTEAVFEELRQWIESGELRAGERLTETALARRLGVSATPVREALRLLQVSGLITHRPHYGAVVRTMTDRELEEIMDLRVAIEPLAAARAATMATSDQRAEISAAMREFQSAYATKSPSKRSAAIAAAYDRLMRAIVAGANSAHMGEFARRLWRSPWLSSLPSDPKVVADLEAMEEAIKNRDPAAAGEAMRLHLSRLQHESGLAAR